MPGIDQSVLLVFSILKLRQSDLEGFQARQLLSCKLSQLNKAFRLLKSMLDQDGVAAFHIYFYESSNMKG